MFDSHELGDELEALKGDVSRLLNTTSEGIFDTTRNRAEALTDQIRRRSTSSAKPWASRKKISKALCPSGRSPRLLPPLRLAWWSASC